MEFNVYIETSIRGPRVEDGLYLYLIEHRDAWGKIHTCGGFCYELDTTENQLALEALTRAVEKIPKPASIRVYTECTHILGTIRNGWLEKWPKNGWITSKGKEVKGAELWKRILFEIDPAELTVTDEPHTYRRWMQFEIGKKMEKKRNEDK